MLAGSVPSTTKFSGFRAASLVDNTTWHLVADIETLRKHLGIEKWNVFGGSELLFFYQNGASHLFPEAWDDFVAPIPEAERDDIMKAYHAQLNSENEEVRIRAARAWSRWEMTTSKLFVDPAQVAQAEKDDWANAFARIENHFFVNGGWMRDGQLLDKQEIDKM
ncbi:hypothetical protein EIP86_007793 [Pleurotus ostreatoroseus]|nr:hypothetical protein EIP86_007793 [Pleurotus ostreatoroseus]